MIAAALLRADATRGALEPLSQTYPELSIRDAYEIQRTGLALRTARGARVVGHKVGLTSPAMQEMLGVDQPDFGYLTDTMVSRSGDTLDTGRFIAPRVEAEILFLLKRTLEGRGLGIDEVLDATEAFAPALEVIDSRIVDWRIGIVDTIADNASSAHVVLGDWVPADGVDVAAEQMTLVVGTEHVEGLGSAVLGHPALAIAWLAATLADYGGGPLRAGDIVLPGAMARALPVARGSSVQATFGHLGVVTASFA